MGILYFALPCYRRLIGSGCFARRQLASQLPKQMVSVCVEMRLSVFLYFMSFTDVLEVLLPMYIKLFSFCFLSGLKAEMPEKIVSNRDKPKFSYAGCLNVSCEVNAI